MAASRSNGEARANRRAGAGPTYPPPPPGGLSPVLERNIRALQLRRQRDEKEATLEERFAEAITRFTGSMRFVYLHLAFFGFWIAANLGWAPGVPAWDQSFVVLAMVASVEAIFLSTFVLISQNRMAAAADKRADLDLQVSLLAEHEVTRLSRSCRGLQPGWKSRPRPMPKWRRSPGTSPLRPCSTSSRRRRREPSSIEAASPGTPSTTNATRGTLRRRMV
jgi:uncharacterized membrane protein